MKPPRTSSLWLAASASAGGSRNVGRKSCEARAITVVRADYSSGMTAASLAMPLRRPRGSSAQPLILFTWDRPQRNQRGLRHCKRCRLGHLETLGPLHPVGDPFVDLVEELIDEDVRRDLLQHTTVRVDEAGLASAGNPEVGVARLSGPVHRTAEHGDFEVLGIRAQ